MADGDAEAPPVEVAAGVLRAGGAVLVCQRRPGDRHAAKWEFPGGKVHPGETLAEGLRRELHEELGIEATVGRVLWTTAHRYPGHRPLRLTIFAVDDYRGVPENRCFAEIRWVPVADLAGLDFLEADRPFVAALVAGEGRGGAQGGCGP